MAIHVPGEFKIHNIFMVERLQTRLLDLGIVFSSELEGIHETAQWGMYLRHYIEHIQNKSVPLHVQMCKSREHL